MSEINAQMYHDAIKTCHEFEKKCEALQAENAFLRALAGKMAEALKICKHDVMHFKNTGKMFLYPTLDEIEKSLAAYSKAVGNSPEIPEGSKAVGEGEGNE